MIFKYFLNLIIRGYGASLSISYLLKYEKYKSHLGIIYYLKKIVVVEIVSL